MSAPPETPPTTRQTGCYVYGIVPGDVELNAGVYGVGNREVKLVRSGGLAALVREVDLSERLGTPEDLQAHEDILDSTAAASPVLPLRFGAVLASEDAVVEALLEPHDDEFVAALEQLDGLAEYLIKGRYIEQAILDEILSQDRGAARLRDQIRGAGADATRNLRIRLGEIINNSVAAKRAEDTRLLLAAMEDLSEASFVREPTHELDAVYAAFLLDTSKAGELEQATMDLGSRWEGRVELRVLGPMAPYDFVGIAQEPGIRPQWNGQGR
jgi:hypothetical protein